MTKVTPAAFDFAVACEALARRGEDLTYEELEAWAMDVAFLASKKHRNGRRSSFDRMRGRTYRKGAEGKPGIVAICPERRFDPKVSRLVPLA